MRTPIIYLLGCLVLALCGCGGSQPSYTAPKPESLPDLNKGQTLQPGVVFHEVTFTHEGIPNKLWVYLPEKLASAKIPCVLIAPAGSTLLTGMKLGTGDRPEHLPYVKAGYAVVSYELYGDVAEKATAAQELRGIREFQKVRAGLVNARNALAYAQSKVPAIDPEQIFTAGHSSAGTLSLLVAEHESAVKGCIAFAPVTDVVQRINSQPGGKDLSRQISGLPKFLEESSPRTHIAKLNCPVFLFHARDDQIVPVKESADFAAELKKTNQQVTLVEVPHGGHHEGMIQTGIPDAINWLNRRVKEKTPKQPATKGG